MKQRRNYIFRSIRFYREQDLETFSEMCKQKYSTVTKELNHAVERAIRENRLPGEAAQ